MAGEGVQMEWAGLSMRMGKEPVKNGVDDDAERSDKGRRETEWCRAAPEGRSEREQIEAIAGHCLPPLTRPEAPLIGCRRHPRL